MSWKFVANDECCDTCSSKDGRKSKNGMFGDYDLPHPNCRCHWLYLGDKTKKLFDKKKKK